MGVIETVKDIGVLVQKLDNMPSRLVHQLLTCERSATYVVQTRTLAERHSQNVLAEGPVPLVAREEILAVGLGDLAKTTKIVAHNPLVGSIKVDHRRHRTLAAMERHLLINRADHRALRELYGEEDPGASTKTAAALIVD